MHPSIDSLRCFIAAARLLSFRAAAKTVHLTPAALGQRIRQLEDQLGEVLFSRTTRKVVLTTAGLALLPYAERCVESAQECVRAARGLTGPPPTEITFGTRHELGLSWVVPQLDPIAKKMPGVTIHLYFGSGADLLVRLRTMEIDCAITSSRFSDPQLDSVPVHREQYAFVGSAELLAKHPLRKPEDASAHTLLDTTADLPLYQYFREAPEAPSLSFAGMRRLGTIEAIRMRVERGAGVAVLPAYLIQHEIKRGQFRRLFPKIKLQHDFFRMVFRRQDPKRSVYEQLGELMSKEPLR